MKKIIIVAVIVVCLGFLNPNIKQSEELESALVTPMPVEAVEVETEEGGESTVITPEWSGTGLPTE